MTEPTKIPLAQRITRIKALIKLFRQTLVLIGECELMEDINKKVYALARAIGVAQGLLVSISVEAQPFDVTVKEDEVDTTGLPDAFDLEKELEGLSEETKARLLLPTN